MLAFFKKTITTEKQIGAWETSVGLLKPKTVKNDDFFSIDIGASSVKVLQLRKKNSNWHIVGMGTSPVNRSVVADKVLLNVEKLSEAIKQAVDNATIKSKTAYAALSNSQTISKVFNIPSNLTLVEEEDFVQHEARNHIPDTDEMRMDYEVLGVGQEDNTTKIHLVATKADQHQLLVDAVTGAGFDLKVMDIDDLAVVRAANYLIQKNPLTNSEEPNEILVDLGHDFTTIYAIRNGNCVFKRDQNFGMKQLIEEISRHAGIPTQEAEKILSQGSGSENIDQTLGQFRNETANQINRLIQLFFADSSHNRVHRIWLSGGGALMLGLTTEVADLTGVPTYTVNPFDGFELAKHLDPQTINRLAPTYLVAFGLSIRED